MEENPFAQFDAEAAATPSDAIVSSTPDMSAPPVDATTQADANPFAQFDEPTTSNPYPAEYAAAVDEFNAFKTKTGEASPEKLQAAWNTLLVRHGIKEQWELSAKGRADHQAAQDRIAKDDGTFQTIDSGVRAVARGTPIVGPYMDEISAGINTLGGLAGDYGQELAYQRERDQKFDADHPYVSTGLQVAGGVMGTLAGARAMPQSAVQNVSRMSVPEKMIAGAATGGALGTVEGLGRGEGNIDERMRQAASDATANAIIGGAVPLAAPVFSKVWDLVSEPAANLLKKIIPGAEETAQSELQKMGASPATVKRLTESLREDMNTGSYQPAAPGDMLLNRGDRLGAAAEVIANSPGEGSSIIKTALRQQQAGEGARVKSVVDEVIGRDAGRVKNKVLLDSERKAAGKMYEAAKSSDVKFDMAAAQKRLAQMIEESDGPVASALKRAQKLKTLRPQEASDAAASANTTAATKGVSGSAAEDISDPFRWAEAVKKDPEAAHDMLDRLVAQRMQKEKDLAAKYGVSVRKLDDAPLTPEEQHFLYQDMSLPDREIANELRRVTEPVADLTDARSEMGYALKHLRNNGGEASGPEKNALARLNYLYGEVERLGGDPMKVLKNAVETYATRVADPEDQVFLAKSVLDRLKQAREGKLDLSGGKTADVGSAAANSATGSQAAKGHTAAEVHMTRMALDDLIEKLGQPGSSAGRNAIAALKEVRAMVDGGLKNNVKGWREADDAFSLVMKKKTAIEDGRSVFSRGFGSPDELKAELDAMDPAVRNAFKIGARDAISELMGTARKEANAAARELLDKGWNREKLQVLLGKEKAGKIADTLEAVSRRQGQANRIAGNSRTAAREAEKKAFPVGEAKGANLDAIAQRGVVGNTLRGLGALVDSAANNFFSKRSQKIATETSKLLTAVGIDQEKIAGLLEQEAQRLGRKLEAKDVARVIRGAVLGVGVSRGTNSGANLPTGNLLPEL